MNHPCDRQTDGQTDGIAIAYARLAYMLSRAKMTTGRPTLALDDWVVTFCTTTVSVISLYCTKCRPNLRAAMKCQSTATLYRSA